jgi:hypothetical protein
MHPTTGYYQLSQDHLAGLHHQAQRCALARAARRPRRGTAMPIRPPQACAARVRPPRHGHCAPHPLNRARWAHKVLGGSNV